MFNAKNVYDLMSRTSRLSMQNNMNQQGPASIAQFKIQNRYGYRSSAAIQGYRLAGTFSTQRGNIVAR